MYKSPVKQNTYYSTDRERKEDLQCSIRSYQLKTRNNVECASLWVDCLLQNKHMTNYNPPRNVALPILIIECFIRYVQKKNCKLAIIDWVIKAVYFQQKD